MIYKHGDQELIADTAVEVISKMRASAPFAPARTDREFMLATAERAKVATGKEVRTGSPEEFLEDLVGAGLLERVS